MNQMDQENERLLEQHPRASVAVYSFDRYPIFQTALNEAMCFPLLQGKYANEFTHPDD